MTGAPTLGGDMEQKPIIARVVHYVSYGTPGGEYASQCRAATVTAVGAWVDIEAIPLQQDGVTMPMRRMLQYWYADALSLCVMNPTGVFLDGTVKYHPGVGTTDKPEAPLRYPGGTWHWPEQV